MKECLPTMKPLALLLVGSVALACWAYYYNPKQFLALVSRIQSSMQTAAAPQPAVFVPPDPLPQQSHWTWMADGTRYDNVVIVKVEADFVSVRSDSGMGRLEVSHLAPEIQKMLHYNPDLAAAAARERNGAGRNARIASVTPVVPVPNQGQPSAISEEAPAAAKHIDNSAQIQELQVQVKTLTEDISFMERVKANDAEGHHVSPQGELTTHGGYDDKIQMEQAEVNSDNAAIARLQAAQS